MMYRTSSWTVAVALGAALGSAGVVAQGPAPGRAVDVRAMEPGPQADGVVAPSASAASMTRDARKEATLKARDAGALKPAGEAAELRNDRSGQGDAGNRTAPAVLATPAPQVPQPAVATEQNRVNQGGQARTSPVRAATKKHAAAMTHGKAVHSTVKPSRSKSPPAAARGAASTPAAR